MIAKVWNGSAWAEKPQDTPISSIVASGTPSSTTYLRGDGTWATLTPYLPLSGGTMTGILYPQNNTSYTTGQARRIILSTSSPSGGGNGDVWIKYTP